MNSWRRSSSRARSWPTHCTPQRLRALELSGKPRFDRELWAKLAEAGLIAAGLPEEQGGAGLGFLTLAGIIEQVGRTAAPVPLLETTIMGALPIAEFGSAGHRRKPGSRARRAARRS